MPDELRATTLRKILSRCSTQLLRLLENAKDDLLRKGLDLAVPDLQRVFKEHLHFCGRYEIDWEKPIHISESSIVLSAVDHKAANVYRAQYRTWVKRRPAEQKGTAITATATTTTTAAAAAAATATATATPPRRVPAGAMGAAALTASIASTAAMVTPPKRVAFAGVGGTGRIITPVVVAVRGGQGLINSGKPGVAAGLHSVGAVDNSIERPRSHGGGLAHGCSSGSEADDIYDDDEGGGASLTQFLAVADLAACTAALGLHARVDPKKRREIIANDFRCFTARNRILDPQSINENEFVKFCEEALGEKKRVAIKFMSDKVSLLCK